MDTVARKKGLRNQPGHKELQENNTGPNKGSIRNCEENSIESRIARKHNQLQVVAHGFRFFKSAWCWCHLPKEEINRQKRIKRQKE